MAYLKLTRILTWLRNRRTLQRRLVWEPEPQTGPMPYHWR